MPLLATYLILCFISILRGVFSQIAQPLNEIHSVLTIGDTIDVKVRASRRSQW